MQNRIGFWLFQATKGNIKEVGWEKEGREGENSIILTTTEILHLDYVKYRKKWKKEKKILFNHA